MTIRALIVDDEPLAREGLTLLLAEHPDVEITGQCANGAEAIRQIQSQHPDLVFLDIEMPRVDGFAVLEALAPDRLPFVIFVTAYDQYAVDAFNVHAIDYLLKPIKSERLRSSLDRLRERLQERDLKANSRKLGELLEQLHSLNGRHRQADTHDNGRIIVRSHGHVYFLQPGDIIWVEASGDYVTIHTETRSHLLRETMRNMESRLGPHGFQRIHRSAIINLGCVHELSSNRGNDYSVVLTNGTVLNLGRSYRESLYASLGGGPE